MATYFVFGDIAALGQKLDAESFPSTKNVAKDLKQEVLRFNEKYSADKELQRSIALQSMRLNPLYVQHTNRQYVQLCRKYLRCAALNPDKIS